jgi:hypothetical protein
MPEISLHFELPGAERSDLEQVAQDLKERLEQLPEIEDVEATPVGQARLTGAEVVAGIAVAVAIVRGGRELVEELRMLVQEIKKLGAEFRTKPKKADASDVTGIRITNVILNIGLRKVPLRELTEDDLEELANMLEEE